MKPTYTIVSKTHDAWLASRAEGIGSSEVATILGLNKYDTPYQLWLRKTGRVQSEEEETAVMRRGHILEDGVARYCADEVGLDIVKSSAAEFVVVDREKPYFRVSPDRYAFPKGVKHTDSNRVIIECKTTRAAVDPDAPLNDYWLAQVIWQLGVSRTNLAYVGWLTANLEFGHTPVFADADFFGFIAEEVERFWLDCVIGGREPEPANLSDILIKCPKHIEGKKAWADEDLLAVWSELKDTKAKIKVLENAKDALEEEIKMRMLDAEILALPAHDGAPEKTLATWKGGEDKQVFNEGAFKLENPELYEKYLITTSKSRRFNLK